MLVNEMGSIPAYHVQVDPRSFSQLDADIHAPTTIPASLQVGDDHFEIGLSYRGAHTRKFIKKSFHVTLASPPLFDGAKEFHLNAEYIDPSLIRNKLSFDFFAQIGSLAPRARHILLYINNAFYGIYLHLESVDEYFLKQRELPCGAIYYAVDSRANFSFLHPKTEEAKEALEAGYLRKCGTDDDDVFLRELIYRINTTPKDEFEQEIMKLVDIGHYLRWLAGAVCTQNHDGFHHNYALYQNRENTLFTIIPWDYDATWGRNIHGNPLDPASLPIVGRNTLSARILDTRAFRLQYCDLLQEILYTTFTLSHLRDQITALHDFIRPFVALDPFKNRDSALFESEPSFIFSFIQKRNEFLQRSVIALRNQ